MKNQTVNPYTNITDLPNTLSSNSIYGQDFLSDVAELQVGYGSEVLRVDKSGLWLGGTRFSNAPFSVDMNGNMVATSLNLSGYLQVGEALGDVQADVSTLSEIKSNIGTITAGNIEGVTITGGVVRTSSGSTRVEMNTSDNALTIHYNGDARVILGGTDAYALTFLGVSEVAGGAIYSTGTNQLAVDTGGGFYEFDDTSFNGDGQNLGASGAKWSNIYADGTSYLTTISSTTITATGTSSLTGKLKIPVGTNLY